MTASILIVIASICDEILLQSTIIYLIPHYDSLNIASPQFKISNILYGSSKLTSATKEDEAVNSKYLKHLKPLILMFNISKNTQSRKCAQLNYIADPENVHNSIILLIQTIDEAIASSFKTS